MRNAVVVAAVGLGSCAGLAGAQTPQPGSGGQPAGATATTPAQARPLRVVVSIPPLQGLVTPLIEAAGLKAQVDVLIPPGVSEHGYEIPPSRMAGLSRADLVVLVGLGMEPRVERVLKDRPRASRRVVLAGEAAGITFDHDHGSGHEGHAHGPNGECLHVVDPHVWLDPVLVEKIVSKVAEELRAWAGSDADTARRIWVAEEALLARVKGVHDSYSKTLAPATRRTIIVGHDAWGYLAKRYNLTTVAIKDLSANEPTPEAMAAAARAIREQGVTTVFVEPQLNQNAGKRIATSAGVELGQLDPLGSGDWFAMMDSNLERIAKALGVTVASSGQP